MSSETSQKTLLKINLEGHLALREKLPEADLSQDLEWDKISDLMYRTMKAGDGLGLAATQVSVGIRMFVMYGEITLINPKIIAVHLLQPIISFKKIIARIELKIGTAIEITVTSAMGNL